MFLDTTFLISLAEEIQDRVVGPARTFLSRNRRHVHRVTVVSLGEIAAGMPRNQTARDFLAKFRIVTLKPEIALEAASIDRELIRTGRRLGENDTWIAGFCRYYRQPVISLDGAFDRVPRLRRVAY